MITIKSFFERLKEPSTYAGIATCLAGCGLLGLTREEWDQILGALVAVMGAAAIFLRERRGGAADLVGRPAEGSACPACGRASVRARIRN